jgi:putative membrane protein
MGPVTGEDDLPPSGERTSPAPGDPRAGDSRAVDSRAGDSQTGDSQTGDATRRTHLANERTYLAWWRTGITALAASVGVGRIVPSLIHQPRWPYAILGAGYALIGIGAIAYAFRRQREVREAVERGRFSHPEERVLLLMSAAGVVLGLLLLVAILVEF